MQPKYLLLIFLGYLALLLALSLFIGRKNKWNSFFNGDRKSPWFIVAFGMIGASLSGVTFISVPGEVGNSSFHYFQFVLGNFIGYLLIAILLLPYFYRKNIYSIYSVLEAKMGRTGYLTTSGFFILSKVIGAAFRLYLAALVIHVAIAGPLGISFMFTVLFCLLLIWLYTYKSGIKMVVWSDMLQTLVLITAVIATLFVLLKQLDISGINAIKSITADPAYSIFDFNWKSPNFFFKQFIAGIFMTIALNGFDQDIVQKNLTCKNSNKAKTNMIVFSFLFVATVLLFLILGALLYKYASVKSIALPQSSDELFPTIALYHLGKFVAVLFILGISAAALSSADSATTALTTAFSIDFLKLNNFAKNKQARYRNLVHIGFSLLIFIVIMLFHVANNESVVVGIFKAAGYTYGPILGVFIFAFFIHRNPIEKFIVAICVLSPIITYLLTLVMKLLNFEYQFGFELIVINAAITISLLRIFSRKWSE